MQAITYRRYGGPDVLSVSEVERPRVGAGELLVRVQAVEASKSDCEMRSFHYSVKWFLVPMRLFLGVRRPRRRVLGIYFAGVVDEVGDGVVGFAPGDAVFGSAGLRLGAYAEFLTVPATSPIAPKPASLTFAEAAAAVLGPVNGLHFVRQAGVRPGDRVLVNGAGGVIGAFAVQVARAMGGSVTGVDAAHKEAFVRSLGATEFVDYRERDVTALDERFDVVVDMVASSPLSKMLALLRPGGRYAHGNPRFTTLLRAPFASRFGRRRVIVRFAAETPAALGEVAAMFDAGELRPIVDRVLRMQDAPEAHRLVETEQRLGAVVLAMGERANDR